MSPWVYVAGKSFAGIVVTHDIFNMVESVRKSCARAEFDRFFNRSLIASAVILLPLLYWRVKSIWVTDSLSLPSFQRRAYWNTGVIEFFSALIIAAGFLWLLGISLELAGAYVVNPKLPDIGKALRSGIFIALFIACMEELLFRGVMLGLWLRFAKPLPASIGCSLVFAFLHFLEPPKGTVIANPAAATAGFELLASIMRHFANPVFFITDFATLFVIGMILCQARLRTGKLWFSIGLHTGWVFAYQGFNRMFKEVGDHWLHPFGVGDSLRSGTLPVFTLLLTAVVCHFVLKAIHRPVNPA